jgi:gluconolactonase
MLSAFTCPPPPYALVPVPEGALAERATSVPPADDFAADSDTVVLEGPVWSNGKLYLSQINTGTPVFGPPGGFPRGDEDGGVTSEASDAGAGGPQRPPPSRLLSLDEAGQVAVVWENGGTNGLALDATGRLLSANHRTGAITVVPLDGQTEANVVATYDGVRFNSPNDITIGRDGTVYFTDPDYQAPVPSPQAETRAYRVAPGTNVAVPIVEDRRQPNGITLSPDGETLYVSASDGLVAYPVSSDGAVGAGVAFAEGVVRSSDGMAVDCAGNLYTTNGQTVLVVDSTGAEVARISVPDVQSVTNVAFGGADNQTIYVTTLGSGERVGLFTLRSDVPGMPY